MRSHTLGYGSQALVNHCSGFCAVPSQVSSLAAVAALPGSQAGSEADQPPILLRSVTVDAALDEKRVERMEGELGDAKKVSRVGFLDC